VSKSKNTQARVPTTCCPLPSNSSLCF
jgi:hypothetical protein